MISSLYSRDGGTMPSFLSNRFNLATIWIGLSSVALLALQTHAYDVNLRFKIAASIAKGERRARERQAAQRTVCNKCQRPPVQCLCEALPKQKLRTQTDVLVLQHPNEFRRKTVSTVPLLSLVLDSVQVVVGSEFNDMHKIPAIQNALQHDHPILLLFPHPDAIRLDDPEEVARLVGNVNESPQLGPETTTSDDSRQLLILLDGTWTQAGRIARHSQSLLDACQKVQFTSDQESIYNAIRKEPKAHCMSTLEACTYAMQLLEPDSEAVKEASKYLLMSLQKLVDGHLNYQAANIPRFVNRGTSDATVKRREELEYELFGVAPSENDNGLQSSVDDQKEKLESMATFEPIDLGQGAILRRLTDWDEEWIDSQWPFQSKKSRTMVQRQLRDPKSACCSLGVEVDGSLKACVLRYANGALGMLHVDEEYRRRGFGSTMIHEATKILVARGERCEVLIRQGNEASEALFQKQGWVRTDPTAKGKSGNRRPNHRWIRVAQQRGNENK